MGCVLGKTPPPGWHKNAGKKKKSEARHPERKKKVNAIAEKIEAGRKRPNLTNHLRSEKRERKRGEELEPRYPFHQ